MSDIKIGKRLIELRHSKNLTQREVATEAEISIKALSSYENDRNYPPLNVLYSLSVVLESTTDYIISGYDSAEQYLNDLQNTRLYKYIIAISKLDLKQQEAFEIVTREVLRANINIPDIKRILDELD